MIELKTPLSEEAVRKLKVGDIVTVTGELFTARDVIHKHVFDGQILPLSLKGQIIFHCGPIIIEHNGEYEVMAAGPTTSMRSEPYQWKIIEQLGIRAIVGKGGMGEKTVEACKKYGCVYLHTIGGAAQLLAEKITKVKGVYFLEEFGTPEAMWHFEIKDFPAVVTIDSNGNSLHHKVRERSQKLFSTHLI